MGRHYATKIGGQPTVVRIVTVRDGGWGYLAVNTRTGRSVRVKRERLWYEVAATPEGRWAPVGNRTVITKEET